MGLYVMFDTYCTYLICNIDPSRMISILSMGYVSTRAQTKSTKSLNYSINA